MVHGADFEKTVTHHFSNFEFALVVVLLGLRVFSIALRSVAQKQFWAMDNRTVGILGGGQLGRMMVIAGQRLGIRLTILDPGSTT